MKKIILASVLMASAVFSYAGVAFADEPVDNGGAPVVAAPVQGCVSGCSSHGGPQFIRPLAPVDPTAQKIALIKKIIALDEELLAIYQAQHASTTPAK